MGRFTISSSKIITIDVEPSDTIKYIKTKNQRKIGVHPSRQALFFSGIKLDDSLMLADYNI
jgi:hypothetical protein